MVFTAQNVKIQDIPQNGYVYKVIDSDGDGIPDDTDNCPNDPKKTEPGVCGCGVADTDSDGDGAPDCIDSCPADPHKN